MARVRLRPPTVRQRRLAAELFKLRKAADLTREQVMARTGVNEITLYRIETGRARPQRRTLVALLDFYNVGEPKRTELLDTSKGAEAPGWLRKYRSDLREVYTAFISFEAEARSERNYESLLVPGLLQTEEYARALVKAAGIGIKPDQVERNVRARMQRQGLLARDEPLQLWAIVDEAAIRRVVGGHDVMRDQLRHLAEVSEQSHVTLQVVPYEKGAHAGMLGAFIYLDFPNPLDSDLVYLESMTGDLFLEEESDIQRYGTAFDHLRALALSPGESVTLLASAVGRAVRSVSYSDSHESGRSLRSAVAQEQPQRR